MSNGTLAGPSPAAQIDPGSIPGQVPQPVAAVPPAAAPPTNVPQLKQPEIDTTPTVAAPAKKRSGCGKFLVIGVVIIVIVGVLAVVLLAGLPDYVPNNPSSPTSTPVSYSEDGVNIIRPVPTDNTQIAYIGISDTDTIDIFDQSGSKISLNLAQRNWHDLNFNPTGTLIAVLSGTDFSNLSIYNISEKEWIEATVYTDETGGITGYDWLNASQLLFTQAGWLHRYDVSSGEIAKIKQVDAELITVDPVYSRVLLRKLIVNTVKEAVVRQEPDPEYTGRESDAPLIDIVEEPAIEKVDYVYEVVDLEGELIYSAQVSTFTGQSSTHVLREFYLGEYEGEYVAVTHKFDRDSGVVDETIAGLFAVRDDTILAAELPEDRDYLMAGAYTADSYALASLDQEQDIQQVDLWNYVRDNAGYLSIEFGTPELDAITAGSVSGESLRYRLLSLVGGDKVNWYTLETGERLLFAQNYLELLANPGL